MLHRCALPFIALNSRWRVAPPGALRSPRPRETHVLHPLQRAGRCWGLWINSGTMAWIIHLPLEPGEVSYACQTSARPMQR
jgi:hypothetical protein